ncbi:MAG: glutamine amidotransferase [Actinomycetaceae bacterium]|nr:glutamine amidotransferase [Actinomycetaceae bacterium]
MKPFLLIQSRPEDDVARDEYAAFRRYLELDESQLRSVRIDQGELPAIELDELSGIVVGGGPFNFTTPEKTATQVRVEAEMSALLDRVVEADFPFLGACYGVGLLTTHQGGLISKRYSEPVGAVTVRLETDDPLLEGMPETFDAFVGHKEACEQLPPSAVLLASSKQCPVQMMRVGRNVYATQFHPELDADGLAVRIRAYRHHGYFEPDEAEGLIAEGYAAGVTTEPMRLLRTFVRIYARD